MERLKPKVRCAVPTCSNTNRTVGKEGLLLFSIPKKGVRNLSWLKAIGKPDLKVWGQHRVCEEHFAETDFTGAREVEVRGIGLQLRKRLLKTAVPSLRLHDVGDHLNVKDKEEEEEEERLHKTDDLSSHYFEDIISSSDNQPCLRVESPDACNDPSIKTKKSLENSQFCLICATIQAHDISPVKHHVFMGAGNVAALNQQLWSTFILQKIINLPNWKYEEILKSSGASINPGSWFHTCKTCSKSVKDIVESLEMIKTLERRVKNIIKGMQNKFNASLSLDTEPDKNVFNIGEEIRYFMKAIDCDLPPKEEVDDNFGESVAVAFDECVEQDKSRGDEETEHNPDTSDEEWIPYNNEERDKDDDIMQSDPLALTQDDEDFDEEYQPIKKSKKGVNKKIHNKRLPRLKLKSLKLQNDCNSGNNGSTPNSPSHLPKQFKCSICLREYDTSWKLENHQRLHERSISLNGGLFDCYICKVPYHKVASIKLHLKRAHDLKLDENWDGSEPQEGHVQKRKKPPLNDFNLAADGKYHCESCSFTAKSIHSFSKHVLLHQERIESSQAQDCPKCNFPCRTPEELKNHLKFKHVEERRKCKICSKVFPTKTQLDDHVYNHKVFEDCFNPDTSKWSCNICQEPMNNKRALGNHKVNNHAEELGIRIWKCTECPKVFSRNLNLRYHLTSHHGKATKFYCDICGYAAFNECLLKMHMPKHTNERLMCEYCSATYKFPRELRTHLTRYHPDKITAENNNANAVIIKPHVSAVSDSQSKRKAHRKEVQCKYCHKKLAHKLELKFHLESEHKDLYIHKCNLCDKIYMSVASLQLHKKLNHAEKDKAVKCKWCLRKVNHKFYLYNHMKACKKKPANLAGVKVAVADDDDERIVAGVDHEETGPNSS